MTDQELNFLTVRTYYDNFHANFKTLEKGLDAQCTHIAGIVNYLNEAAHDPCFNEYKQKNLRSIRREVLGLQCTLEKLLSDVIQTHETII